MAEEQRGAVFYDVDGTLVDSSIVYVYIYYALRLRGMGQRMRKLVRGMALLPVYRAVELASGPLFNRLFYANYRGVTEDRLILLGREIAREVLLPNLYPGATDRIEQAHRLGLKQVLVSASLEYVLRPFAEALGIQYVIGNRLEMDQGTATGRLLPPVLSGKSKLEIVRDFATRNNVDLQQSYALSASRMDAPLLREVGFPVAVNPQTGMARTAHREGWPIIQLAGQTNHS